MRTTKEVWDHHCIAFANADIDEVMSDFAEDAIYITADRVIRVKKTSEHCMTAILKHLKKNQHLILSVKQLRVKLSFLNGHLNLLQ